jgi:hypothetical protein
MKATKTKKTKLRGLQSASELYRPSGRRMSAKLEGYKSINTWYDFWVMQICSTMHIWCGTTPWPLVRKRTIPTERPPLVGQVNAETWQKYYISLRSISEQLKNMVASSCEAIQLWELLRRNSQWWQRIVLTVNLLDFRSRSSLGKRPHWFFSVSGKVNKSPPPQDIAFFIVGCL